MVKPNSLYNLKSQFSKSFLCRNSLVNCTKRNLTKTSPYLNFRHSFLCWLNSIFKLYRCSKPFFIIILQQTIKFNSRVIFNSMVMPIYAFVLHFLCLQCRLVPRAFRGRLAVQTCAVLSCCDFILWMVLLKMPKKERVPQEGFTSGTEQHKTL